MNTPMTSKLLAAILALPFALALSHADTVNARCDIYPTGSDQASAMLACTFSQQQGHVAIDRADGVRHELSPQGSAGAYLDQDGKPAYRQRGLGSRGQIYRLTAESVFVYWDTAGLPGHDAARPAKPPLGVLPAAAAPKVPFDQTLTLLGITFRVTSANKASLNELTILPSGLAIDNSTVLRSIDGQVTRAEVADLDADGSPEIYVYVVSAGSGSYGSLVAYCANRRKSLSEIHLPPVADSPAAARGYMGHDDFAVVEGMLIRRFPVYRDGDQRQAHGRCPAVAVQAQARRGRLCAAARPGGRILKRQRAGFRRSIQPVAWRAAHDRSPMAGRARSAEQAPVEHHPQAGCCSLPRALAPFLASCVVSSSSGSARAADAASQQSRFHDEARQRQQTRKPRFSPPPDLPPISLEATAGSNTAQPCTAGFEVKGVTFVSGAEITAVLKDCGGRMLSAADAMSAGAVDALRPLRGLAELRRVDAKPRLKLPPRCASMYSCQELRLQSAAVHTS